MSESMTTLSGGAAHNSLAAAVQMYCGIISDYERQLALLRQQYERVRAEADELARQATAQAEAVKRVAAALEDERKATADLRRQIEQMGPAT